MRAILQKRALRFVLLANVVSMLGSGMNAAAVAWHILQATHSEMALGTLAVLQTLPAMLLLPFTGVIIDREDRRRLVMMLDSARALVILTISILAFRGKVQVWQLYLMNTLVAAGFWMFWPTITALIQELTPEGQFMEANTFLLAGIQGGWLMAGAIVGFVYNHIGLGGVLLIDFTTYVVSFLCYFGVRKGKHVVPRPAELRADIAAAETAEKRFWHELWEGIEFLRDHPNVVLLGLSWALFLGAMLTGVVVTPSLSDRVFHAGAVGYGWLNAGWGVGAFLSALYAPKLIARLGPPPGHRSLDGVPCEFHDALTLLPHLARSRSAVRSHGISPWRQRRCHEHQSHGAGSQALHGTRAERFLLRGHLPADRAKSDRRLRGSESQPGRRLRNHWLRLPCGILQRSLAHRIRGTRYS